MGLHFLCLPLRTSLVRPDDLHHGIKKKYEINGFTVSLNRTEFVWIQLGNPILFDSSSYHSVPFNFYRIKDKLHELQITTHIVLWFTICMFHRCPFSRMSTFLIPQEHNNGKATDTNAIYYSYFSANTMHQETHQYISPCVHSAVLISLETLCIPFHCCLQTTILLVRFWNKLKVKAFTLMLWYA